MNEEQNYEIVKFVDEELEVDVSIDPKQETIWLTKNQIARLFNRDRSVISKHIKHIFDNNELDLKSNVQKMHIANSDKPVEFYNLDIILSVGYRVNSKQGIKFRQWANKILKQYLIEGYVVNKDRTLVTMDNYNKLVNIVIDIHSNQLDFNNRLIQIEDKVFDKEYGLNKLFYNGEFYDAYTLIQSIFEEACNEIIIIDNNRN